MINLPLANSTWGDEEIDAIHRVIKSNCYTMGSEVKQFEESFAHYFGSKYAVMVNSGSSANLLAVAALTFKKNNPLQRDDEIIVPSLSWPTTFYPVAQYGMKLVFVDVDLQTLNIDPALIEKAITPKTKAIFVPNILGNPADWLRIKKIADQHNLYLIEDNCESMGATLGGQFAGTFGILGTFSCFFSHHISTMEGGFIVTDDEELYSILLCLRAHGWTRQLPKNNPLYQKSDNIFYEQFHFLLPGYNVRPLEMSGAIGNVQLKKLPHLIDMRRKNAAHFVALFKDDTNLLIQSENGASSWFGFSFIIKNNADVKRGELLNLMTQNNIETRPVISGNFLRQPAIQYLNHHVFGEHRNADHIHDHGFFIGNHHFDIRKQLDNLKHIMDE